MKNIHESMPVAFPKKQEKNTVMDTMLQEAPRQADHQAPRYSVYRSARMLADPGLLIKILASFSIKCVSVLLQFCVRFTSKFVCRTSCWRWATIQPEYCLVFEAKQCRNKWEPKRTKGRCDPCESDRQTQSSERCDPCEELLREEKKK